jgi:hypothetical protein
MVDNKGEFHGDDLELYKLYRSYVEHEDRLTTDRINRTILVHGFLIASYGLMLQARVGAITNSLGRAFVGGADSPATTIIALSRVQILIDLISIVIALLGIVTTISAARGIRNSKATIYNLKDGWNRYWEEVPLSHRLALPALIGDGTGRSSTRLLINGLITLWIIMFLISICSPVTLNDPL